MPLTDPALWDRLQNWLGPQDRLHPLARTVMAVHEVPRDRASAMVEGYARFIYLTAIAKQPLAPPPLIDAVWHEHLADHDDYLGDFTVEVVGKYIQRQKSRPARQVDPDYAATLKAYRAEFDATPMWQLWPAPSQPGPLPWLWFGGAGLIMALSLVPGGKPLLYWGIGLGIGVLIYVVATDPWRLPNGDKRARGDAGGSGAGSDASGAGYGVGRSHRNQHDCDQGAGDGGGGGGGDGGGD